MMIISIAWLKKGTRTKFHVLVTINSCLIGFKHHDQSTRGKTFLLIETLSSAQG